MIEKIKLRVERKIDHPCVETTNTPEQEKDNSHHHHQHIDENKESAKQEQDTRDLKTNKEVTRKDNTEKATENAKVLTPEEPKQNHLHDEIESETIAGNPLRAERTAIKTNENEKHQSKVQIVVPSPIAQEQQEDHQEVCGIEKSPKKVLARSQQK